MGRNLAIGALVATLLVGLFGGSTTALSGPLTPGYESALGDLSGLVGLGPNDAPLPADPTGALVDAVAAFQAALGFSYDASGQILDAGLEEALAGRTAQALDALRACYEATQGAIAAAGGLSAIVATFRADPARFDPAAFQAIHDCAMPATQALANLEAAAMTSLPTEAQNTAPSNLINIWPVLVVDTGGDDAYENDYVLIVELAGSDTYDNNAGSNMIDTRFAPASSPVPGRDLVPHVAGVNDGDDDRSGFGRSEGCAIALGSLEAGNCTPIAAALVDTSGNDQYGVFHDPVPGVDARCTADQTIGRMVTNGVGFLGYGMLLDSSGNDAFNGRTGSNGAGHIFGVGVLDDRSGNDNYLDVRNAQGFSLIAFAGLLLDEGGNDQYDRYMPSALVPGTPDQQEGAGGVIDDENLCDTVPRFLQGAGDVAAVGVLIDLGGNDKYDGACATDFQAPGDIGAPACSQGFGQNGAVGAFFDLGGGNDQYTGVPDRANGATVIRATPDAATRSTAVEFFIDR